MSDRQRRRIFLAALLVSIVVAPLAIVLAPQPVPGRSAFEPVGYYRTVEELFIRQGWITVRSSGNGPIVFVTEKFLNHPEPAVHDFYAQSFLKRDIEMNDPALWRTNGALLSMAYGTHDIASPFRGGGWRGDLLIANAAPTLALVGDDGWSVALSTAPRVDDSRVLPPSKADIFEKSTRIQKEEAATLLRIFAGGAPAAMLRMIGPHPYIEVERRLPGGPQVMINGSNNPLDSGEGVLLFPGSIIDIRVGSRETHLHLEGGTEAISRQQLLGQRIHPDGRFERFATAFDRALDGAVLACESDPGRVAEVEVACPFATQSFTLTLTKTLDDKVQDILLRAMLGSDYPAAVTILDARNGDVLALASYDPEDPKTVNTHVRADPLRAESLPVNENFELMSVGSTAKPLVSAAILSRQELDPRWLANIPPLRDLVVTSTAAPGDPDDKNEYVRDLLGISLITGPGDSGLQVHDGKNTVDFNQFIGKSSNLYAAALLLWGAGSPLPVTGQQTPARRDFAFIHLDGKAAYRSQPQLPQIVFELGPSRYAPQSMPAFGARLRPPAWLENFRQIFAIDAVPADGATNSSVWRGLLRSFPDEMQPLLGGISPSLLNWNDDGIQNFRNDYIPIILGGEAYRWPTVALAESYARLVTGKTVRARIISDPAERLDHIPRYPDDVRTTICNAMETVLGGTAAIYPSHVPEDVKALGGLVPKPFWLGFYSKTGTPQNDRPSEKSIKQEIAENALIGQRLIVRTPAGLIAVFHGDGTPIAIPLSTKKTDIAKYAAALKSDKVEGKLIGGADAEEIIARAAKYNSLVERNRPDEAGALYVVDSHGTILRVAAPPPKKPRERGHLYVFVVEIFGGEHKGTCTDSEPLFAWTVAINVQNPDGNALYVADKIITGVLRDVIQSKVRTLLADRNAP